MNSRLYSLAKACSWRVFATLSTVVISYLITHQVTFALYIGAFEFISKIFLFYIHERFWEKISLNFKKSYIQTS